MTSVAAMLKQLGEDEGFYFAIGRAGVFEEITAVIQAAEAIQAARDWTMPDQYAEFIDLLDKQAAALARLRATLEKQP